MVSVSRQFENCEKCGEDSGLECFQTRTNDASFQCGNCGWFWESTTCKFGQDVLVALRESLKGCNRCAWESVDPLLASLLVECCNHRDEGDSLRTKIEELLEKPHVNRTEADRDAVVELSSLVSLFVVRDGKRIFDKIQGYRETSVAAEPHVS